MDKYSIVYVRANNLFIVCENKTEDGMCVASEPRVSLDVSCSDEVIGRSMLDVLKASQSGVSMPNDWKQVTMDLLGFLGFKSWGTFARYTRAVSLSMKNRRITIMPSRRESGGAFMHRPEESKTCPATPKRVGATFREVLELCE